MSTTKRRVVHVPLTDKEWRDLRSYAVLYDATIGSLVAGVLRKEMRVDRLRSVTGDTTK